MDVVCFGQQNWDFCWTGKQQLMTRLAARGHRVLYVDPDLDLDTHALADVVRSVAPIVTGLAPREIAPRLWVFTHRYSPILRWRLSVRRFASVLRGCLERLGLERAICLTQWPRALPLSDLAPFAARVHYAIDEMTAYGGLPEAERLRTRALETELVRRSHRTLAVSPRLVARLREIQPDTWLLPSGADTEHFAPQRTAASSPLPELARLPRPLFGFVGQIDERLDPELLLAVARHCEGSIVLVGRVKPGVDVSALAACERVHFLGYRPFPALPAVLRDLDVCMVPFRRNALTDSSSPLKVYDYLAAGKPVVSVPLEGLLECACVVRLAETPGDFASAVAACLADPDTDRDRRLAVAAANSWEHRTDALEEHLGSALDAARRSAAVTSG
jgi:glycosyltransferase involved in cell wall biosynthesis